MISEKRILEIGRLIKLAQWEAKEFSTFYGVSISSAERYIRLAEAWDKEEEPRHPDILLIDIETAPLLTLSWRVGSNITMGHHNILCPWYMISWAGKWLLKDEIFGECITRAEARGQLMSLLAGKEPRSPDKRISKPLWETMEKADIVIAHNGDRFDIRKMNKRFIINGFNPYSPIGTIDTLKQVRKIAAFSSNKLDYLNKRLGLPQKAETEYELWKRCYLGDQVSLDYMFEYNKTDIVALERLFLLLRPWMKGLPNMALHCDHNGNKCPSPGCDSESLDWKINSYYTSANRFPSFRCNKCGAIGRGRLSELELDEREKLTLNVAR